ncbi:MAG: aspartate aminotransferase family protein [Chloroflexota bacterium]
MNKKNNKDLVAKAHKFLPGGSLGNLSSDVIIDSGLGSKITDVEGNEYIDYLLGSGPMITGHAHPDVMNAVKSQLENGTTFFANNEPAILLAEEISNAMECVDKVRFSSTGTEATMYAMRAARAFTKKDKILKFEGGFHGMNDYALQSMMPAHPNEFPAPKSDSGGIPAAVSETMLIAPFNDIEITQSIIEEHKNELGGVIVEPFQRLLPPKPGFLEMLRQITLQHEIPLIFDEVVTSFRFAFGGAQEFYGITPDICSLGKAVAGGFPLTAVGGREDIMSHFDASAVQAEEWMPQIGTLSGNPIAAVAGLATVKILKKPGTYERMHQIGNTIKTGLINTLNDASITSKVIGEGVLFDVFFTDEEIVDYRSTLKADKPKLMKFNQLLREHGVFKGDSKFYLSTEHDESDAEHTIEAFKSIVDKLS